MLPELILKEEEGQHYLLLVLLGFISAVMGYGAASILFPSEADLIAIFLASVPLVFPLTKYFLENKMENGPHLPEIAVYGSLFLGELTAFFALGFMAPESFEIQISMFQSQLLSMGITGYAASGSMFSTILLNNLMVFMFILGVSLLIGSAGAFILTWNASVLGVFLGILTKELSNNFYNIIAGTDNISSPLAYIPHATFEMSGFIVAGVAGSLISAAIYREHFELDIWQNLLWLALTGVGLIFVGAGVETGRFIVALISLVATGFFGYRMTVTTQNLNAE